MVHGDDTTLSQTTPFVSRYPGRVSALVLVCLVACLSHRDTVGSNHSREFEIRGTSEHVHRNAEERSTLPIADRNGTFWTIPPAGLVSRSHEATRERVPDEAWPAVAFAGRRRSLGGAISRTVPRIIRWNGTRISRGLIAALRNWADGRTSSTRRDRFPFTGRFS